MEEKTEFLVFSTKDNHSYVQGLWASSYEEACEEYIMMCDLVSGRRTHSNVIEWEDGTYSVLSLIQ